MLSDMRDSEHLCTKQQRLATREPVVWRLIGRRSPQLQAITSASTQEHTRQHRIEQVVLN
jgi:hypothetical protein